MAVPTYITKKHYIYEKDADGNRRRTNKVKEIEYRTDADFSPKKIDDICIEFIENYCVANNQIDWLLEASNEKEIINKAKDKEKIGKKKKKSFVGLRADFVKKFFPEIVVGKPEKVSFIDAFNAKYGK